MVSFISVIYAKLLLGLVLLNQPLTAKLYKLEFDTAYNQFYIGERGNQGDTGATGFWSEQAYHDKLAVADDVLGIGTGSYGHIKAELILLDKSSINK